MAVTTASSRSEESGEDEAYIFRVAMITESSTWKMRMNGKGRPKPLTSCCIYDEN